MKLFFTWTDGKIVDVHYVFQSDFSLAWMLLHWFSNGFKLLIVFYILHALYLVFSVSVN